MQDGADVLLTGDAVDHGHAAVLVRQQAAHAVHGIQSHTSGGLRHRFPDEGLIFRQIQGGKDDVVPADHLGDVVEVMAAADALAQHVALRLFPQPRRDDLRPALQKIRRQKVQELRRTGGVGVDVAGDVQTLLPRPRHPLQRRRDALLPVAHPHGLEVADVQRRVQRPRYRDHLGNGVADHVALLAHMHRNGNPAVFQGRKGADQFLCRVKTFRRVAKTQRDGKRALAERPLQPPVQFGKILRRFGAVAAHIGADGAVADQHADVQGKRPRLQRGQIFTHGGRRNAIDRAARDGPQIAQKLLPVRLPEGCEGESAVAVEDRRQPLPQFRMAEAVAEDLRVAVAVDIDEARRDAAAARVHRFRRFSQIPPNRGDFSVPDGEVGPIGRAAAAVEDGSAAQDHIKHVYPSLQTIIARRR